MNLECALVKPLCIKLRFRIVVIFLGQVRTLGYEKVEVIHDIKRMCNEEQLESEMGRSVGMNALLIVCITAKVARLCNILISLLARVCISHYQSWLKAILSGN